MQIVAKAVVSALLATLIALTVGSGPLLVAVRSSQELAAQAICRSALAAALEAYGGASEAIALLNAPFASNLSTDGDLLTCTSGGSRQTEPLPLPSSRFECSFQGELRVHVSAEGGLLSWWL